MSYPARKVGGLSNLVKIDFELGLLHIRREDMSKLAGVVLAIVAIDVVLEYLLLPFFYSGVPLPFGENEKPIGGAITPVTFFHAILVVGSIFGAALAFSKLGIKLDLVPKDRAGKIDLIVFGLFLFSGLLLWYTTAAVIVFAPTAIYLLIVEMR